MESDLGPNNADVINLKEYYSLLEIKDYLLAKSFAQKCNIKPITVIYFYKNDDCDDCTKQGYVLTALRDEYPTLRVYSFDADLNLSAITTLEQITKVSDTVPTLVIDGDVYTGFQSIDAIEKVLAPELKKLQAEEKATAASASTSTVSTGSQ